MLNTRLNDSCGSCPRCPGMLRAGCRRLPGEAGLTRSVGKCQRWAGGDEIGGSGETSRVEGLLGSV